MNERIATSKTVDTDESLTDFDILVEIGSMGAGHATTTLSKFLHEPIKIEVPRVHLSPPQLVPRIYGKYDTIVTAVFMQLRGTADCDIMLVFEEAESKKIAELITNILADSEVTTEMEMSAIEEMGSIVLCSFLNVMADLTLTKLVSTPPQLIVDSFDAIMDGLLIKQALCSEVAVIFDTRFKRCAGLAEGVIIAFPSEELQRMLAQKGKGWLADKNVKEGLLPTLMR